MPALKLGVTAALLVWLLRRADLAGIASALAGAHPAWVGAAFALHFVGLLISALRWRLLLRPQGADVTLSFLCESLLVGVFFNNFLPSTVGGDLMRARDTAAHAGSATGALAVVGIERVSGVLALGFFAAAALLAGALPQGQAAHAAAAAAIALLAGFVVLSALLRPRPLAGLRRCVAGLRARQTRWVVRAAQGADRLLGALEALAREPRVLRATFLLALLLQATVILHYWCVARALDLRVPAAAFPLVVPVATVLLLLPVSINGIGAREAVFAFLLGAYGVSLAQSLAFSWVAFGTVLAYGLLGGLLFALRRRG